MSLMIRDTLLLLFVVLAVLASLLFFNDRTKNASYLIFAVAFFCMGLSGYSNGEPSAIAAFLLALIASRKFKTKFDRK